MWIVVDLMQYVTATHLICISLGYYHNQLPSVAPLLSSSSLSTAVGPIYMGYDGNMVQDIQAVDSYLIHQLHIDLP